MTQLHIHIMDGNGNPLRQVNVNFAGTETEASNKAVKALQEEFREGRARYPFHTMQIGDTHLLDIQGDDIEQGAKRIVAAASIHNKRHRTKIVCRTLTNGKVKVRRVR